MKEMVYKKYRQLYCALQISYISITQLNRLRSQWLKLEAVEASPTICSTKLDMYYVFTA